MDQVKVFILPSTGGGGWQLFGGYVELDSTGVSWDNAVSKNRIEFAEIQKVFLWSVPDGKSRIWYCGIIAGGKQVSIGSGGKSATQDSELRYREFLAAFTERLSHCSQPINFNTVPEPDDRRMITSIAALVLTMSIFLILTFLTNTPKLPLGLGYMLVFLGILAIFLKKPVIPQCYSAANIPDSLRPPAR